tara:strand:- start:1463 stop:2233 length:771 start_codon:yes stop_codon:yes gene_type:complete
LKNRFTILGCGSSLGAPWITNYWGNLNKKNKKNIRTRCCAHIQYKNISILIDTSPDIKEQIKKNKIDNIDAVVYTHEHADQSVGIFELRPFFWKNKKKIPVYGSKRTSRLLNQKYTFCFKPKSGYKPIMKSYIFKENFRIIKKKNFLNMRAIELQHGMIKANGFVFNKVAYLSDCNKIPKKTFKHLKNLNFLIIDCLRKSPHPSHFHYAETIKVAKMLNAKKTILTNLHVDLDYSNLKKKLPKNIIPAFDGLSFNF